MSLTPSQLAAQPQQHHAHTPAVAPRVKRCPSCDHISRGDAFFCAQCGADISLERSAMLDENPPVVAPPAPLATPSPAATAPLPEIAPIQPAAAGTLACPLCMHANPSFAILSMACGADLAQAKPATPPPPVAAATNPTTPRVPIRDRTTPAPPPVPGTLAKATAAAPRLQLLIGNKSFDCNDGDILGRAGTLASDLFAPFGTVSRHHASIILQGGRWFIVPSPSVHNATRLDGAELKRGEPTLLTGEHTLGMSTKCEVKLRVVPA